MQRLHERDLTGHLLERGGFEHLCLPAEYEPSHPFAWPDDPRHRARGGVVGQVGLCPARGEKLDLGSYGFASQYQQRPAPEAGGILKRDWWRYYDPKLPLPDFRQWSC